MTAGIIYYTDNRLREPYYSLAQQYILCSGLPISSCSLKSINFGKNVVIDGIRSYPTMLRQIVTALENSEADFVFFAEHDVLYHFTHFNFIPQKDNVFYYNKNVYRWWIYNNYVIRYDRMLPLSCMCVNRQFALEHYRLRVKKMNEWGLDHFRSREPRQARIWGYEPGTKPRRRGGFSDDVHEVWSSEYPNIDIRHTRTFSSPKVNPWDFIHLPTGWEQKSLSEIEGWDLKSLFNLK